MKKNVRFGLENLVEKQPASLKGKKLGLLCNPASVNHDFTHASHLIFRSFPGQLTTLFSPQHGFYAEKQDNMIESDHFREPEMNLPVYSLYGETRIPTETMFGNLDVLLVDIQDVGTRVYTFIYTISYCLEIAAALNKKVVILDRPNPINGLQSEGNLLETEYSSFVGRFPIPMRHGMTVGEICMFFNDVFDIGCDLEVVAMTGWDRSMYWQNTGRVWIPPSPNLPTPLSCMVYPGQVILEGTNISEGRGTTLPFEQFGAPYLDTAAVLADIDKHIKGACLRRISFEPTSGKWCGQACRGFHIHVTNPMIFEPYLASLLLVQSVIRNHPEEFEFKQPPYEYEFEKLPMDLILGSRSLREALESGQNLVKLQSEWEKDLDTFNRTRKKFFLYE